MPISKALDAQWIDEVVRLIDEDDLDIVDIGVHRNVVFRCI